MRYLLLPLSWIYGLIIVLRNKLFDWGLLKATSFPIPVVVVGNLSAGGTGKSPLVLQLAEELGQHFRVGILSRGYGRSTTGFRSVDAMSTAAQVGDEPMQYRYALKEVRVAVCEKRVEGIREMLRRDPDIQVILLDDAFQHRWVRPGISMLLTDYSRPYYTDSLLPAGYLREPVSGADRADLIIMTKCPLDLSLEKRLEIASKLKRRESQKVLFSYIRYRELSCRLTGQKSDFTGLKGEKILLVCGIANPEPLVTFLESCGADVISFIFPDHHAFSAGDGVAIRNRFHRSGAVRVLTTRKDSMRMDVPELRQHLDPLPIFIVEIQPGYFPDQKTPAAVILDVLGGNV